MLGYKSSTTIYGGAHMTVCVGYEVVNGQKYVYVSDAHHINYVRNVFNLDQENDFIATVRITEQ